jgi:hypothetical protein
MWVDTFIQVMVSGIDCWGKLLYCLSVLLLVPVVVLVLMTLTMIMITTM